MVALAFQLTNNNDRKHYCSSPELGKRVGVPEQHRGVYYISDSAVRTALLAHLTNSTLCTLLGAVCVTRITVRLKPRVACIVACRCREILVTKQTWQVLGQHASEALK